eukprot:4743547-Prymnesium_polylepis.2
MATTRCTWFKTENLWRERDGGGIGEGESPPLLESFWIPGSDSLPSRVRSARGVLAGARAAAFGLTLSDASHNPERRAESPLRTPSCTSSDASRDPKNRTEASSAGSSVTPSRAGGMSLSVLRTVCVRGLDAEAGKPRHKPRHRFRGAFVVGTRSRTSTLRHVDAMCHRSGLQIPKGAACVGRFQTKISVT